MSDKLYDTQLDVIEKEREYMRVEKDKKRREQQEQRQREEEKKPIEEPVNQSKTYEMKSKFIPYLLFVLSFGGSKLCVKNVFLL